MTTEQKLNAVYVRLIAIRAEQQRQMSFAGERLGVFKRLKELALDERRVMKRITDLEASDAH